MTASTARLLRSTDFERVLKTRSRATSPHFALHHLGAAPSRPPSRGPRQVPGSPVDASDAGLEPSAGDSAASPGDVEGVPRPVEAARASIAAGPVTERRPDRVWLGAVVPKRHARRSVTRSLLKRQIRSVVDRHASRLAAGLWIVRLRSPFDRAVFRSAASDALKRVARDELDALFACVAAGPAKREPPATGSAA